MSIEKKLLGTNPVAGGDDPEGVSFDGTNDYLSRSSALSGNSDSNVFTFSAWVYLSSNTFGTEYLFSSSKFSVYYGYSHNEFIIYSRDSSNTVAAYVICGDGVTYSAAMRNTWCHLLVSVDLSDSSKRHAYINDEVPASILWNGYTDVNIAFTTVPISVGKSSSSNYFPGRIAHVFLDYTYRDLSVESNRRLFIDSDGKPSSTIPSSPIIYLPMTDAATAGSNSGTGGDFTVNGVLDTAVRGPNQDNCSASVFDGSADKLNIASMGASNGKLGTLSLFFKAIDTDNNSLMIDGTYGMQVEHLGASDSLQIKWFTDAGGNGIAVLIADIPLNASHHVSISFDTANSSNRKAVLNGVLQADSVWTTYIADALVDFNTDVDIGSDGPSYFNNVIGEVYMDNTYTDLATDNPFWDADANRPKPVRQVIDETGTTPLIALPLRGDDPGNNLGSGGDFTVYSGPYTGARGGSEFWARSAYFGGEYYSTPLPFLDRASLTGSSDGSSFTVVFSAKKDTTGNFDVFGFHTSSYAGDVGLKISLNTTSIRIIGRDSGGTIRLDASQSFTHGSGVWNTYSISAIAGGYNEFKLVINGTYYSVTPSTNNSTNLNLSALPHIGRSAYNYFEGDVGFLYYDDSYIDFSQEANRNLFVDQLGYPKDLTPAIEAGDITEPLIYMKFDDTSALGTNSGTGGNFTVSGDVHAGSDVVPNA